MADKLLAGQVALITGGGKGIGRGLALGFAQEGASVVVNYKQDEAAAAETLQAIREAGGRAIAVRTDISRPEEVEHLVAQTIQSYGQIDVLVNNAGTSTLVLLKDMTVDEWDRIIGVDLRGAFLCTRAVVPHMLERKYGRIIFIAGELAHTGGEGHTHVAAAKGGVVAFSKSVAYELGPYNITANTISPGPIRTPLLDSVPREFLEKRFADIPVGHFGEVGDILRAALYFADPRNTYVTGQTLLVNGGHFML
ncbi:MAG: SDR family oxidoreductase [Acidobacteria bacterium]|nr:SDR family oxidoreductase [Acidobacteriota bacterium]